MRNNFYMDENGVPRSPRSPLPPQPPGNGQFDFPLDGQRQQLQNAATPNEEFDDEAPPQPPPKLRALSARFTNFFVPKHILQQKKENSVGKGTNQLNALMSAQRQGPPNTMYQQPGYSQFPLNLPSQNAPPGPGGFVRQSYGNTSDGSGNNPPMMFPGSVESGGQQEYMRYPNMPQQYMKQEEEEEEDEFIGVVGCFWCWCCVFFSFAMGIGVGFGILAGLIGFDEFLEIFQSLVENTDDDGDDDDSDKPSGRLLFSLLLDSIFEN